MIDTDCDPEISIACQTLSVVRNRTHKAITLFPTLLAMFGIIDRKKGEEAFNLAAPVMVTGGLRTFLRFADFFMVSIALGSAAVAGLEFAFQYYFIPFGLALALTSGTISVVSRFEGADEHSNANFAIKQSLWLSLSLSIPITAVTWFYAEPMIALLTTDSLAIKHGATYLRIVMVAVAFRFWGMIAARALQGAGDTRTPMYIRLVTIPTNLILNAVLIFGFGPFPQLGIAGAAWGTVFANILAAVLFFLILVSGDFAVHLPIRGKQWDTEIALEIIRVGLPLAGTRLAQTAGRFPFLFILGLLGTHVVAAYAIGRRIILLALMPAWGYSTASSTLVGQHIGAGNDTEATEYGWEVLRLALVTQLLIAVVLVGTARPIAALFDAQNQILTIQFIQVLGLSVAGFSIARTLRGSLRGAGDTRWPFYGTMAGTYLVRIPIAVLALPTGAAITVASVSITPGIGLGLLGIYAAIVIDFYVRAGINFVRFRSGQWKAVAQSSSIGAAGD